MDNTALVLVILGALNWGAIGLFGVDILGTLLGGQASTLARIVFSVVGLAGLWSITILFKEKLPARYHSE